MTWSLSRWGVTSSLNIDMAPVHGLNRGPLQSIFAAVTEEHSDVEIVGLTRTVKGAG
jgi:hypothetical protein